ncbi:hypothetical protein DRW07_11105 [Alteromonas sediminis]|uniref:Uncharacterized protein n=1 Tax=Alteromonas sediminis TaxID=2259342 RepID=A0A3N5XZQ1_9ALTE|nr:hypothetical protein [Alteromonas sediminis]RPJ66622.1 hypothetical protein DRW07_11105 [Alteromonas sediminis]
MKLYLIFFLFVFLGQLGFNALAEDVASQGYILEHCDTPLTTIDDNSDDEPLVSVFCLTTSFYSTLPSALVEHFVAKTDCQPSIRGPPRFLKNLTF